MRFHTSLFLLIYLPVFYRRKIILTSLVSLVVCAYLMLCISYWRGTGILWRGGDATNSNVAFLDTLVSCWCNFMYTTCKCFQTIGKLLLWSSVFIIFCAGNESWCIFFVIGIIECLRLLKMGWAEMLQYIAYMVLYLQLGSSWGRWKSTIICKSLASEVDVCVEKTTSLFPIYFFPFIYIYFFASPGGV